MEKIKKKNKIKEESKREKKHFTTAKSKVKNIIFKSTNLLYEAVSDSNITILINF